MCDFSMNFKDKLLLNVYDPLASLTSLHGGLYMRCLSLYTFNIWIGPLRPVTFAIIRDFHLRFSSCIDIIQLPFERQ